MTSINILGTADEKFLRAVCTPIESLDEKVHSEITNLINIAEEHRNTCAGLSMNQIWKKDEPTPKVFVMQVLDGWKIFINPEILKSWNKRLVEPEGCLSIPKKIVKKDRARHIRVRYRDEQFNLIEEELFDFASRVFQHELDHLEGKVMTDE